MSSFPPSITEKKQHLLALMQQARWQDASALCKSVCDAAPQDVEAWILRAAINSKMGNYQQAVDSCVRALQLQPAIARLHYNLGVALQMLRCHPEAAESYRRALELDPVHAPSRVNLALALRNAGRLEEAVEQAQQAIQSEPGLVEAYDALSLALIDMKRWVEAAESCTRAIRVNAKFPDAHAHLGLCLEAQAHVELAMASYQRAIELDPFHGEALSRIGCLFSTQGKHHDAIDWLRRAIEANPDDPVTLATLGGALMNVEDYFRNYAEAEQCYRRAIDIKPDDISAHLGLASVYQNQGRYPEALACLERAVEHDPLSTEARAAKALLLERIGRIDQARETLRPLLDSGVDHVQVDLAFATLARSANRETEAIDRLQSQLRQTGLPNEWRRDLHYALGKLYDQVGEYDEAFEHYRAANELNPYLLDELRHEEFFDALVKMYSADGVRRRPRASNRSRLPIFIVGMPRSGTSLVEQILASHPKVHGAGELGHIPEIADAVREMLGVDTVYPYYVDMLTRRVLDQAAQSHLDRLAKLAPKAARVSDKMPHNFRWLGFIDQLFPGSRVIHCVRDPLDTCLSIHFQKLNMHHTYASDLGALGRYYRRYQTLMAHWHTVLRVPILDLRYEELAADQEGMTRKLISFCGLEWDDQCLRFYESGRIVSTPSYDQVRRPIYAKSVARWKNYEKHLGSLKEALGLEE